MTCMIIYVISCSNKFKYFFRLLVMIKKVLSIPIKINLMNGARVQKGRMINVDVFID